MILFCLTPWKYETGDSFFEMKSFSLGSNPTPASICFGVRWWGNGAFFDYFSGGGLHFCIYLYLEGAVLGLVSLK